MWYWISYIAQNEYVTHIIHALVICPLFLFGSRSPPFLQVSRLFHPWKQRAENYLVHRDIICSWFDRVHVVPISFASPVPCSVKGSLIQQQTIISSSHCQLHQCTALHIFRMLFDTHFPLLGSLFLLRAVVSGFNSFFSDLAIVVWCIISDCMSVLIACELFWHVAYGFDNRGGISDGLKVMSYFETSKLLWELHEWHRHKRVDKRTAFKTFFFSRFDWGKDRYFKIVIKDRSTCHYQFSSENVLSDAKLFTKKRLSNTHIHTPPSSKLIWTNDFRNSLITYTERINNIAHRKWLYRITFVSETCVLLVCKAREHAGETRIYHRDCESVDCFRKCI